MARVKLNDGSGHWIDGDGELMTTVHTSMGWLVLPDSYEVLDHADEAPDDGLDMTILVEVKVQSADFTETI
mgnify:CR=1 FL=1